MTPGHASQRQGSGLANRLVASMKHYVHTIFISITTVHFGLWLWTFLSEWRKAPAASLSEYATSLFAGTATFIFGFIGFLIRLSGSHDVQLNSYPEPWILWVGILICAPVVYYFTSDTKFATYYFATVLALALIVIAGAPILSHFLKS